MTMREAFLAHIRPELARSRAAATVRNYETAIKHWETFCRAGPCDDAQSDGTTCELLPVSSHTTHRQDDVTRITNEMLSQFRTYLAATLGASTVRKLASVYRAILRACGPQTETNPRGAGLSPIVYFPADPSPRKTPRVLYGDELAALYSACACATWPQDGRRPETLWRALLVLYYTYGFRTRDLLDLPWAAVTFAATCPDPRSTATNALGWFEYSPVKVARVKPGSLVLPLNAVVERHLRAIQSTGPQVFGWSRGESESYYGQWRQIVDVAGITACQIRDLRKTCNTAYHRIKTGLGEWILGHAPRGTNQTYYLGIEREVIAAVHALEYPPVINDARLNRQKWLW